MKISKYPKSVKYLNSEKFIELFQDFIDSSYKGKRTKPNGQRIRNQTVDNYQYTLKHLQTFFNTKKFDLRLYLVNHLSTAELRKAKLALAKLLPGIYRLPL